MLVGGREGSSPGLVGRWGRGGAGLGQGPSREVVAVAWRKMRTGGERGVGRGARVGRCGRGFLFFSDRHLRLTI